MALIKRTHTSTYVPDPSMLNDLAKGGVAEWTVKTEEDEYLIVAKPVEATNLCILVTRRNPAGYLDLVFNVTGGWWAAVLARYGAEASGVPEEDDLSDEDFYTLADLEVV